MCSVYLIHSLWESRYYFWCCLSCLLWDGFMVRNRREVVSVVNLVSASASPFKSNHFTMQSLKSSHRFIIKNLTRTQTLLMLGSRRIFLMSWYEHRFHETYPRVRGRQGMIERERFHKYSFLRRILIHFENPRRKVKTTLSVRLYTTRNGS